MVSVNTFSESDVNNIKVYNDIDDVELFFYAFIVYESATGSVVSPDRRRRRLLRCFK